MRKSLPACLFAAGFALILFSGCDEVDPPFSGNTGVQTGNNIVYRKILVEDYTGHLCGQCPDASRELYNVLKPLYGDTIITIGVHAGPKTFTGTCPGDNSYPLHAPAGSYAIDYRTPAGTAWFTDFSIGANPKGMINRKGYPAATLDWAGWGTAIDSISGTAAKMKLQIQNSYDPVSGNLTTSITTTFLASMTDTFRLSVVLTEDSIVDWQKDYILPDSTQPYGQSVPDFVHRHVMRGALNSEYGEQIKSGSIAYGDSAIKSYTVNLLSLPSSVNPNNPALNIAHCYIIAFVYDYNSKEILQVEEEKVE